jgi:hypothetical protein
LVVYDNVESLEILNGFIPSGTVDILITTRDAALAGSEVVPFGIALPLLDNKDACALFVLNLGTWSPSDSAAIRHDPDSIFAMETVSKVLCEKFQLTAISDITQILSFVDRLPLAIVQCASYLRQYPMSFSLYLEKFRAKAPETLRKFYSHPMKGATYHQSVMTTWNINIDKLSTNAVSMITFFGCLERTRISITLLERALDDCRFWGGNGYIPLPDPLKDFFAFLDIRGDFYESIGALDSLSLITRDTSNQQIHIHPLIHEYIHLRLSEGEAVTWIYNVTCLLRHLLPPLLYSNRLDKDAAQQTEEVFSHLGRHSELVELYHLNFSPDMANASAVFYLEAYLWYRGLRYLGLAEKLMTHSAHPDDLEMLYGARLLALVTAYQANPGNGFNATAFEQYVHRIRHLPVGGRGRPPASKSTLQQAILSHRWIESLTPLKSISHDLRPAVFAMPFFSWQTHIRAVSEQAIDRIAVAVYAQSKAKAIMATFAESEQDPEDRAVDLLWTFRDEMLLGLDYQVTELGTVFDDLLNYQTQIVVRRKNRNDARRLLNIASFYYAQSSKLQVCLQRHWAELEEALTICLGKSRLTEVAGIPHFLFEDDYFCNQLLVSASLRQLIFDGLYQEEEWLKQKVATLEKRRNSEERVLLLRRLKARLAEVYSQMGGHKTILAHQLLKDIFRGYLDRAKTHGDGLTYFGERLLESVPDAETFHTKAPFYREIVTVLLSLRREEADALVRHWAGHLYSLLEEESSETVLPHLCSILIPWWDFEARTSTRNDAHAMDTLDRLGFYIINLPGPADVWPITSLRAYRLCRDICGELQAKSKVSYKRMREWIAKVDDFDGLFGRFGSWRDMPITARDITEITLAGIRLQRCAASSTLVKVELLERSFNRDQLDESYGLPLPEVVTLPVAHEPTFVGLPLGRILGTTTQVIAASYHGPRCGVWVAKETRSTRGVLIWTRPERAGVFYMDVVDGNVLHRFFDSWREMPLC